MSRKPYQPLPVRPDADSSFIRKKLMNIPYAQESGAQKLDLYYPNEGDGPFPTIVYFHGGGFFMRDKTDDQCQAFLNLTKAGYVVASCNYRLTGEAYFPAMVYDTKAATRFLRANAATYNLDADKFVAAGQSAGGYLSVMLAATGGRGILEDLSQGNPDISSKVQACIDWFGVVEFELQEEQLRRNGNSSFKFSNVDSSVTEMFFGAKYRTITKEMKQEANILGYITESMPPTLIQHGLIDHLVPYQQSKMLEEKIWDICGRDKVRLDILADADHDDPLFNTPENVEELRKFLDKALKINR